VVRERTTFGKPTPPNPIRPSRSDRVQANSRLTPSSPPPGGRRHATVRIGVLSRGRFAALAKLPLEEPAISSLTIAVVVVWVTGFGYLSARLADRYDRQPLVWVVLGAVLGPLAIVLLVAAPPGRCRSCRSPTRGWLTTCAWCHEDVRAMSPQLRALLAKVGQAHDDDRKRLLEDLAGPLRRVRGSQSVGAVDPSGDRPVAGAALPDSPTASGLPRMGPVSRLRSYRAAAGSGAAGQPTSPLRSTSAIFVTGSGALEPGRRYEIRFDSKRLRVSGPVEVDPTAAALELDMREVDASSIGGRLLISHITRRSRSILRFKSLIGITPDDLAGDIARAGRTAHRS
jgi:hypothetical protein